MFFNEILKSRIHTGTMRMSKQWFLWIYGQNKTTWSTAEVITLIKNLMKCKNIIIDTNMCGKYKMKTGSWICIDIPELNGNEIPPFLKTTDQLCRPRTQKFDSLLRQIRRK